ncbi:MAG TPA: BON domain-containing protein [Nitrospira sp.]
MMQLVDERYVPSRCDRDAIVSETLNEWFSRRPSLKDVNVSISNGLAVLSGYVISNRDRALAIDLALDGGAREVEDDLLLRRPLVA